MNNREQLMEMMSDNELDRQAIAEMLKVKRDQVDRWLLSSESKNHEEAPDMAIELLRMKIKYPEPAEPEPGPEPEPEPGPSF